MGNDRAKVGIVTVTYNSAPVLPAFMNDVLAQTHSNFILYIIDNVSTDDSVDVIREYDDERIVLMVNMVNSGVAGGNNQGILRALADGCSHVMLLNNDIEMEHTCLEKLLAEMDRVNYSMIIPKMMYYFDKSLIWYAGSVFQPLWGNTAVHTGLREEDNGQFDKAKPVEYGPTCCMLFRREVFEDIGLMDEQYFAYYDDTDFLLRAHLDGRHKLWYYPDMEFYHKIGQSSQSKQGGIRKFKFGDFHIKLTTRNKVYYLRKQGGLKSWLNIVYFFLRLHIRFLLSGKYHVNLPTWKLIRRSFREGMQLPLPDNGKYTLIYNKVE